MISSIPTMTNISFDDYLNSNIQTTLKFESVREEEIKNIILHVNSKLTAVSNGLTIILIKRLASVKLNLKLLLLVRNFLLERFWTV